MSINNLKFDKDGLIPAIVQDYKTKDVLMMAYMNKEALEKTLESGKAWFFSRSRGKLWLKGETSGNYQLVKDILYDCDNDTLLIMAKPKGPACHTGERTCFHRELKKGVLGSEEITELTSAVDGSVIEQLYSVILQRKKDKPEGSYTAKLLAEGLDKILAKVDEESEEVIEAAMIKENKEVIWEVADLLYHLLVLLAEKDISFDEVENELRRRWK
ncbi:MAG: bifunctional phosphoribosyl-AMP cyclohydrolase/phosphoribosyl-ATP diphosphatase HisIE [Actinobacteria bacterium]|nr:MAG: bifunctional phosphoribosyl-AMP cyclohydrolase/phosphoribosyl-ATP diphosphatase HisIE [Actinomycetota bacterium]